MLLCELSSDEETPLKNILSDPQRRLLQRFCSGRVLVAFDYDGTLAPLAPTPEQATMRSRTRALLARVALRYPCVVISGRSRASAQGMLEGVPLKAIIGNYGAEWPSATRGLQRVASRVRGWRRLLAPRLQGLQGVVIEDKRYSLAVHYRHAPRKAAARRAIEAAVADLLGATVEPAILAYSLVPEGAPTKADALRRICAQLRCDRAIYVGDDVSDEAAFALRPASRYLGVRVGRDRRSAADYYLPDQKRVDDLLKRLHEARFEGPAEGRR